MHRASRFLPRTSWQVFLFFLVCTALLYGRTLFFDYVYLDDTLLVRDSKTFLTQPGNLIRVFTGEVFETGDRKGGIFYRPLLTLSFLTDAQLFRFAPWGFRLTNLVLHTVSSFLIYVVLCRYTARRLAFFLSFLFLVHPLFAAAVAWIPGRNDTLLAVFILSSYLSFLTIFKGQTFKGIAGHCIFFSLAVLTKETAVVFPVVCLFSMLAVPDKEKNISKGTALSIGALWIGISIGALLLRHTFIANAGSYTLSDMAANLWLQSPGIIPSIGKIFFPVTLSVYPHLPDMSLVPGSIALAILLFAILGSRQKKGTVVGLGLLWFFLFLLPTMTIRDQYSNGIIREHRMYIPMLGLLLLLTQIGWLESAVRRRTGTVIFLSVLLLFAIRTVLYAGDFRDSISFWSNAARTSPTSPVAHLNLGAAYARASRRDDALGAYKRAAAIAPALPGVWNNMGVIFMEEGAQDEAREAFLKELANPASENGETHAIARRNLERLQDTK